MGDLIMTGPALRALKETFGAKITVLTSSMAAGIAKFIPEIDDIMICDLPWVKNDRAGDTESFNHTVIEIRKRNFDAAIVFTVYSQNPLPTVMLAYLAGIPNRLAYCRENPYQLLTDWVPDKEPYSFIKHQVRRDLDLVAAVGAQTGHKNLYILTDPDAKEAVLHKLKNKGIDIRKPWLILHPGVSESKREYPKNNWIVAGKKIIKELNCQVLITGGNIETELTQYLSNEIGAGCFDLGGIFNLEEFIALISISPVLVSVNTGTVHIAAALGVPVVVLYALTNPQHTPWQVPCKVLTFMVPEYARSKNEVIKQVNMFLYNRPVEMPDAAAIINAVRELLNHEDYEAYSLNCDDSAILQLHGHVPVEDQVG